MEKRQTTNFVTLDENLLSLFFSGVYLTNYEFLKIAKKLNFNGTVLKDRDVTLRNLLKEAKDNFKFKELEEELINLIETRINEYQKLANSYENTSVIIKDWIEKANNLKLVIKEKLKEQK
jgi:hypothetical protein